MCPLNCMFSLESLISPINFRYFNIVSTIHIDFFRLGRWCENVMNAINTSPITDVKHWPFVESCHWCMYSHTVRVNISSNFDCVEMMTYACMVIISAKQMNIVHIWSQPIYHIENPARKTPCVRARPLEIFQNCAKLIGMFGKMVFPFLLFPSISRSYVTIPHQMN